MDLQVKLMYVYNGHAYENVEDIVASEFISALLPEVESRFSGASADVKLRICEYVAQNLEVHGELFKHIKKEVEDRISELSDKPA